MNLDIGFSHNIKFLHILHIVPGRGFISLWNL